MMINLFLFSIVICITCELFHTCLDEKSVLYRKICNILFVIFSYLIPLSLTGHALGL